MCWTTDLSRILLWMLLGIGLLVLRWGSLDKLWLRRLLRWWRSLNWFLGLSSHSSFYLLETHHLAISRNCSWSLLGRSRSRLFWCDTPQASVYLHVRNILRLFISLISRSRRPRERLGESGTGRGNSRDRLLAGEAKLFLVDSIRDLSSLSEEIKVLADWLLGWSCRFIATKSIIIEGIVSLI